MNILTWALDLIYPPKCVFCGKILQKTETDICTACRKELPRMECSIRRGECYETCYAAYYYEDKVAESIRRFKFSGRSCYAGAYGRVLAMLILREQIDFDIITWVPISNKRASRRGYRQSKLLTNATAKELGLKAVRTLRKIKDNVAQSSIRKPEERKKNVENVYRPTKNANFSGKRILLIDDVITSGATLSECARTLKKAGAKSIVCLAVAATRN